MTDRKDDLITQAQIIRQETNDEANTAERIGRLHEEIATYAVIANAPQLADLYVGPTGDDSNDGSSATPFLTIDRALELIDGTGVATTIHVQPSADPGGHVIRFLEKRHNLPQLTIVGEADEEIAAPIALTSYGSRVYDFSGAAPGWTPGAYRGLTVRIASTSTSIPVGQKRTIIENTGDTMTIFGPHRNATDTTPDPGDTFNIIKPAVLINVSPDGNGVGWFGGTQRRLGAGTTIELRHLRLNMPDGDSSFVDLFGGWQLHGVLLSQDNGGGGACTLRFQEASARWALSSTDRDEWGWGVATEDRGGNFPLPGIGYLNSRVEGYTTVCSYQLVEENSVVVGNGGFLDATNLGFPHGNITCRAGGYYYTAQDLNPTFKCIPPINGDCLAVEEQGRIDFLRPIENVGAGDLCSARSSGFIQFIDSGVLGMAYTAGSGLDRMVAEQGGAILLKGWDGANSGDAVVGTISPISDSRATWAVDEHIESSIDFSSFQRTS